MVGTLTTGLCTWQSPAQHRGYTFIGTVPWLRCSETRQQLERAREERHFLTTPSRDPNFAFVTFNEGLISLGGLVAPTADFANILCEIGREKAWQRANRQEVEEPTYSGMMTYEKAAREFQHLKFMLNMPIVVMGIDYKE